MRKMRNCAQLIFAARKMRKFAPTRKPVALETLLKTSAANLVHFFRVRIHGSGYKNPDPDPNPQHCLKQYMLGGVVVNSLLIKLKQCDETMD